jgi:hypothetical protein
MLGTGVLRLDEAIAVMIYFEGLPGIFRGRGAILICYMGNLTSIMPRFRKQDFAGPCRTL